MSESECPLPDTKPLNVTLSHSVCLLSGLLCAQLLPLEEDLQRCRREQQEAQLRGRELEQRVEELENRNAAIAEERERQVKLMEVKCPELTELK